MEATREATAFSMSARAEGRLTMAPTYDLGNRDVEMGTAAMMQLMACYARTAVVPPTTAGMLAAAL